MANSSTTSQAPSDEPVDSASVNPSPLTAATVRVQAVNAGGKQGIAGVATGILKDNGYQPVDAADAAVQAAGTVVVYATGARDIAVAVANRLFIGAEHVHISDPTDPQWKEFGDGRLDVLIVYGRS